MHMDPLIPPPVGAVFAVLLLGIAISVLAGDGVQIGTLALQSIGMVAVVGLVVWLSRSPVVHLPLRGRLQNDPELQVFVSLGMLIDVPFVLEHGGRWRCCSPSPS